MYPPGVKRLFDHLQPSQVRNVASLLAQAKLASLLKYAFAPANEGHRPVT